MNSQVITKSSDFSNFHDFQREETHLAFFKYFTVFKQQLMAGIVVNDYKLTKESTLAANFSFSLRMAISIWAWNLIQAVTCGSVQCEKRLQKKNVTSWQRSLLMKYLVVWQRKWFQVHLCVSGYLLMLQPCILTPFYTVCDYWKVQCNIGKWLWSTLEGYCQLLPKLKKQVAKIAFL